MGNFQDLTRKALQEEARKYAAPKAAFAVLYRWFCGIAVAYLIFVLASNIQVSRTDEDWTEKALKFSSIGYLVPDYDDAYLESRFRTDRINTLKRFIETELSVIREDTFYDRRSSLEEAAIIACRMNRTDGRPPPSVLAGLAVGKIVRAASETERAITCTPEFVGDVAEPSSNVIRRADLNLLITWFRAERGDTEAAEKLDFSNPAVCTKLRTSDGSPAGTAISILADQACSEAELLTDFRKEMKSLEDSLSFDFLRSQGDLWILHLIAWSLFGLIANTLAGTIKSIKNNNYNGMLFIFFFPKLILAPLIAIVVVALVVYGVFQTQIVLSHQPMFLAFAFFSGYASERFNGILSDAMNGILASQKFDQAAFESAMRTKRIPFMKPPRLIKDVKTIADVEKNVMARMHHNVATELARAENAKTDKGVSSK